MNMKDHNLSNLDEHEKNLINLQKHAAYLVWKVEESICSPAEIRDFENNIINPKERDAFKKFVSEYKKKLGKI